MNADESGFSGGLGGHFVQLARGDGRRPEPWPGPGPDRRNACRTGVV